MQRACSSSSRFHLGGEQTPAFNARLNGVGVAFCNVMGVRVLAIIARSRTTKCPIRAGDNRIMHGSATAHTRTHYPNDSICLERRQCSAYVCVCVSILFNNIERSTELPTARVLAQSKCAPA